MDVRLDAEQRALRQSVADALARLRPGSVIDLDDQQRAARLQDVVTAAGWLELRSSGVGSAPLTSAVEPAIVAEQLGAAAADTAFLGPTLATELRRLTGAPAAPAGEVVVLDARLAGLVEVGPSGLTGPGVAFDCAGAKSALVLTATPDGYRLAGLSLPDAGDAGESTGPDLTRPLLTVPAGTAVESVPGADRTVSTDELTRWTALGLALACADLVGIMDGTTALARDYATVRSQYGAVIGSFQAVQHLLADAVVATEGSRSIALHAAWAVDALPPAEALAAAAAAKAYCGRAARTVCETSIQVHGGIGNTWECFAHVYLRRALTSIDLLGGVASSLRRVQEFHGIGGASGLR